MSVAKAVGSRIGNWMIGIVAVAGLTLWGATHGPALSRSAAAPRKDPGPVIDRITSSAPGTELSLAPGLGGLLGVSSRVVEQGNAPVSSEAYVKSLEKMYQRKGYSSVGAVQRMASGRGGGVYGESGGGSARSVWLMTSDAAGSKPRIKVTLATELPNHTTHWEVSEGTTEAAESMNKGALPQRRPLGEILPVPEECKGLFGLPDGSSRQLFACTSASPMTSVQQWYLNHYRSDWQPILAEMPDTGIPDMPILMQFTRRNQTCTVWLVADSKTTTTILLIVAETSS